MLCLHQDCVHISSESPRGLRKKEKSLAILVLARSRYSVGVSSCIPKGCRFNSRSGHILYFAMYNVLPCIMCAYIFMCIIHGIMFPLYPCVMLILFFPSKIWAKGMYYTQKNRTPRLQFRSPVRVCMGGSQSVFLSHLLFLSLPSFL